MTRKLTGTKVLLWLLGTFGVVFAVNGLFIAKALETYPGEDVHNPYLQGIDYNRTIANHAIQAARGWRAIISGERDERGNAIVAIVMETKKGDLPEDFALTGELRHPADAEKDHALIFNRTGPNTYTAHASRVAPGAWDVAVTSHSATPFEASRRLWFH